MIEDFPVCIGQDGTVVAALQWDYAAWTPRAAAFSDELKKLANETGHNQHVLVAISGQMSPRLQQELQSRGVAFQDRLNPGPLK
jgi:ferredoxin-NADP reductase